MKIIHVIQLEIVKDYNYIIMNIICDIVNKCGFAFTMEYMIYSIMMTFAIICICALFSYFLLINIKICKCFPIGLFLVITASILQFLGELYTPYKFHNKQYGFGKTIDGLYNAIYIFGISFIIYGCI